MLERGIYPPWYTPPPYHPGLYTASPYGVYLGLSMTVGGTGTALKVLTCGDDTSVRDIKGESLPEEERGLLPIQNKPLWARKGVL